MSAPAHFETDDSNGTAALRFSGNLTLANIGDLPNRLNAHKGEVAKLDLSGIERLDTVGAWLVHRFSKEHGAEIVGLEKDEANLLKQVAASESSLQTSPQQSGLIPRVVGEVGEATVAAFKTMHGLIGFFGATLVAFWNVVTHPRRFRMNATVHRFEIVGVTALGIIGLMSFLIGIVIAQQGAVQLRAFGAEIYTINLVGRITLRELGVLMTAIMVAGRSGSAFAAQIGTMQLTEEVDAMRTIGVSPMEALVLPRMIAVVVMMPLLAFYASLIGIIGGGLLCWIALDIPPVSFIAKIREVVPMTDLWICLIKAPVFGFIIALAGCYQGMQVKGDAEQVGARTTTAVVQAIFLVIVLDAIFAVFFSGIGWK